MSYGTSIGGVVLVFLPPGVKGIWSPCLMAHLLEEGCNACLLTSMVLVCLGSSTYC